MAGVKGRSGRRGRFSKDIESLVGDNRRRALSLVNQFLKDPDISIKDKINHAMAINLKSMPDKQEILQFTAELKMSDESARRLIKLAEANLALREALKQRKESIEVQTNKSLQETPAIENL